MKGVTHPALFVYLFVYKQLLNVNNTVSCSARQEVELRSRRLPVRDVRLLLLVFSGHFHRRESADKAREPACAHFLSQLLARLSLRSALCFFASSFCL